MILFACRYSSHVNGTAHAGSDDDTRFVYAGERPETQFHLGHELRTFLRECRLGFPDRLDLLFMPESAYLIALPAPLREARNKFITLTALDHYLGRAESLRRLAVEGAMNGGKYSAKKAYHAFLYLNSAAKIAAGGTPDFAAAGLTPTLLSIRNTWTQERFEQEFYSLATEARAKRPALPKCVDYSIINSIFAALMGVSPAEKPQMAPTPATSSNRTKKAASPNMIERAAELRRRLEICQPCGDFKGIKSGGCVWCDRVADESRCRNLNTGMCPEWQK